MDGDTPQYYVKVSGGTVNGKAADWLNPGSNTFKPNAKSSTIDSAWSGQTAAVAGNIRYHKEHVYTPRNKTVTITGPTTVTIAASDYTETINQKNREQYTVTSIPRTGIWEYNGIGTRGSGDDEYHYVKLKCSTCGAEGYEASGSHTGGANVRGTVHNCGGYTTTQEWKPI